MGFSGCGPTIAALLPKMGFGGCVTHIAELLPKNGILWVVSMAALRLAKMGFSGCVLHLQHYCQRWRFFSFVHIEALLPKMMGYSDYVNSHCGMIAKDGIFSGCVHNCSIVAKGGLLILWLCMCTLPTLLPTIRDSLILTTLQHYWQRKGF
jgi:hypothetical protein